MVKNSGTDRFRKLGFFNGLLGIAIDQAASSRVERGERCILDYEAQAIAKSLKVTVAWLFGEA